MRILQPNAVWWPFFFGAHTTRCHEIRALNIRFCIVRLLLCTPPLVCRLLHLCWPVVQSDFRSPGEFFFVVWLSCSRAPQCRPSGCGYLDDATRRDNIRDNIRDYPRTLHKHFTQALYKSTLHKHFTKALHTSTLHTRFAPYTSTWSMHFTQALYTSTLSMHFTQALDPSTLSKHFIQALYTSTLSKRFIQALYQGISKAF